MLNRFMAAALVLTAVAALAENPPNLLEQKMGWMVGDWRAATKGSDGKPLTVEISTRWSDNHQALVYSVWFASESKRRPAYTGMYVWHPAKEQPALFQVNEEGVVTEGDVSWQGDVQVQDNRGIKGPGQTFSTHTETRREGNDAYDWRAFLDQNGKRIEVLHMRYERVK